MQRMEKKRNETLRFGRCGASFSVASITVWHFFWICILWTVYWVRFTENWNSFTFCVMANRKRIRKSFCNFLPESILRLLVLEEERKRISFFYRIPEINIRLHSKRQSFCFFVLLLFFIDHREVALYIQTNVKSYNVHIVFCESVMWLPNR